jgi:hypothetical protein
MEMANNGVPYHTLLCPDQYLSRRRIVLALRPILCDLLSRLRLLRWSELLGLVQLPQFILSQLKVLHRCLRILFHLH